jgi:hypothetical protein
MKKLLPLIAAVTLILCGTAAAQSKAPDRQGSTKTVTIFGMVSDDGKTIFAKNSRTWVITNPGMLAGREGHRVKVKSRVYLDTNNILVLSVKLTDAQTEYAANKSDSAFRR